MSTFSAFFYNNLLHPEIFQSVIDTEIDQLEATPAVLPDYVRHRVKATNQPAVVHLTLSRLLRHNESSQDERSVRGAIVYGLASDHLRLMDIYFGDKYTRKTVKVFTRGTVIPFLSSVESIIAPEFPLIEPERCIEVQTYVWRDCLDDLTPDIWTFDHFVREKLWRWVEGVNGAYHLVDESSVSTVKLNLSRKLPICQPPPFGHALLSCFGFDKTFVALNQGSFGAVPRAVIESALALSYEIEISADKFYRYKYPDRLTGVRARLASMLGAKTEEIVMVQNTTFGINTILRNFIWSSDDIIVATSTTFGTILRSQQYIHDVPPHPQVSNMTVTFPTSHKGILQQFRKHLKSITRKPNQKVVAIIDSVVSHPGCIMPWAKMVEICREEDVLSIIDGAHSIGQEVGINLGQADPDFFVGNCHKWLYSIRGCAVLYVPLRNQHYIRSSFPTSFGYVSPDDPQGEHYPKAPNFVAQFIMPATQDATAYLSVTAALEFREKLGGETKINEYCHRLAVEGGERLAKMLKTSVIDTIELIPNMINVTLPLGPVSSSEPAWKIKDQIDKMEYDLAEKHNCFLPIFVHSGKWWTRCSTQVWTELSDFDLAVEALLAVCKAHPWQMDQDPNLSQPLLSS